MTLKIPFIFKEYIEPGMFVLDMGCGDGEYLREIQKITDNVIGIDIKEYDHSLKMDLYDMTFKDSKFDVVVCYSLFQFLDLDKAIKEIKRVLKPDGILLVATSPKGGFRLLRESQILKFRIWHEIQKNILRQPEAMERHRRIYTNFKYRYFGKQELLDLLESKGFEILEYKYARWQKVMHHYLAVKVKK